MAGKVIEEHVPVGGNTRFDLQESIVITYINQARQLARFGPGQKMFECPTVPGLSKAEVQRHAGELLKLNPAQDVRVLFMPDGTTGIFTMKVDPSWRKPTPSKVDLSKVGGDPTHKRLWQVCRDQEVYLSEINAGKPDCSAGCRYFIALEGEHGMDWGVCSEPRSPRSGLLTFEHMGCEFFEAEPEDPDR